MPSRLEPGLHKLNATNRLVLSALSHAFDENIKALQACGEACSDLAARSDAKAHEAEAVQLVQDALRIVHNLKALVRWIYPRKTLPREEALRKAETLRELGDDWVTSVSTAMQKFPEGAPPRMRQSHIDAFEFMLQSKKNSLGRAVPKFCTCGGKHTAKCRERLKTGIRSLKKMLREYVPDLVSEYELLHPDRATKGE